MPDSTFPMSTAPGFGLENLGNLLTDLSASDKNPMSSFHFK
jgi:hypothetical protein